MANERYGYKKLNTDTIFCYGDGIGPTYNIPDWRCYYVSFYNFYFVTLKLSGFVWNFMNYSNYVTYLYFRNMIGISISFQNKSMEGYEYTPYFYVTLG
jgi:hypothetical protein